MVRGAAGRQMDRVGPDMRARIALQAETPRSLAAKIGSLDEAEARRVVAAVHRDDPIDVPIRGVRRAALEAVRAACDIPTLVRSAEQRSALDPFRKLALAGRDGRRFETVRIPLEKRGRFSVCVSSQVGCALACAFCATGRMGLLRNLETWEIVEQVREVRRTLGVAGARPRRRLSGDGRAAREPRSRARRHRCGDVIRARSPSTPAPSPCAPSGIPSGILRLAREAPTRSSRHLDWLGASRRSCGAHAHRRRAPARRGARCRRDARAGERLAPMWAVTLLEGRNDSLEHARALADRSQAIRGRGRPAAAHQPDSVQRDW